MTDFDFVASDDIRNILVTLHAKGAEKNIYTHKARFACCVVRCACDA